jgi:hypothetical protein
MSKAKGSLLDERAPLLGNNRRHKVHRSEQSPLPTPSTSRHTTDDLDDRLKRWLDYIARRDPKKAKMMSPLEKDPQFLFSVFEKREKEQYRQGKQSEARWDGYLDDKSFAK